jgi:hypothetical protein
MINETCIPREPLARFADFPRYFPGTNPSGAKERHLPEGVLQLAVNPRDDRTRSWDPRRSARRFGHAVVIGPRADWCAMDNAGERFNAFRELPGLAPTECRLAKRMHPNHLPMF